MKRARALAVGATALLAATSARAAPDDAARADQLFKDGTGALEERRFDEACPKLAESRKIDPKALGTLVNLARCNEEWNKTATAYAQYIELETSASERKQLERVALAKKHRAVLEAKLSRIAFKVQRPVDGEVILVDGATVDVKTLPPPPFDPGEHTVQASAPGKTTFSKSFTVNDGPSTADVVIPALEGPVVAGPVAAPTNTASTTSSGWSMQKKLGVVAIGGAVVGLAVGSIFGVKALGKTADVKDACPAPSTCRSGTLAGAKADYESARSGATISTIAFIAGGVLGAGGAVLFLTAPSSSLQVAPAIGARSGGLTVGGSF